MAETTYFSLLDTRGVLTVAGEDRRTYLQGLVSNDMNKVSAARAVHAALLTAQGKYLHDFFVVEIGEVLHLDGERERLADLKRRLSLYKLRSKVTIAEASALAVAVAWGVGAPKLFGLPDEAGAATPFADSASAAFVDPRLPALGVRIVLPRDGAEDALTRIGLQRGDPAEYDRLRLSLGVPDGSRDLTVEKAILLEAGFDELNGIDWKKGCYIGQELTARTKYRGIVKKRLLPVAVEGALPAPGTLVRLGDKEAGEMRSGRDGLALALLRLEALEEAAGSGAAFTADGAVLRPAKPAWAQF
ncbi:MAG TPA: folate-binding protein [Stellaceae bacterium]